MPLITQIGADASQYNKVMAGLGATAQSASNDIVGAVGNANNSLNSLGGTAMSTSMRFQQMRSGMSAARDGMIGLTMSGQRADMALVAMGHHFTSLVNETGSLGGAFKALGSSLLGVGGVILAVTLAAELWREFSKSQKDANDATVDYVSTLTTVRQAALKGQSDGEAEIVRLKILYDATQNHSLSLRDRNLAYDELDKKYPKFFSNADREKTLLGENQKGYEALTIAIENAARAKANEAQIGTNTLRSDTDSEHIKDIQNQKADLEKQIATIQAAQKVSGHSDIANAGAIEQRTAAIEHLNEALKNYYGDQNRIKDQNSKLGQLSSLEENAGGYKTESEDTGKVAKIKEVKTQLQLLEEQYKKLQDAEVKWIEAGNKTDPFNLTPLERQLISVGHTIDDLKEKLKLTGFDVNVKSTTQSSLQSINPLADQKETTISNSNSDGEGITHGLDFGMPSDADFEKAKKALADYSDLQKTAYYQSDEFKASTKEENTTLKDLTKTIGGGLMQAFQSTLNGSQSFLQSFGNFLEQLIEKIIAAAAAAAILAGLLALTGFTEVASFGSLFGQLSGLGGLVSGGASSGGLHLASGGITTGPTRALIGESGPEAVIPLSHLPSMIGSNNQNGKNNLVATITGSDLQLWQNRSGIQKGRIG